MKTRKYRGALKEDFWSGWIIYCEIGKMKIVIRDKESKWCAVASGVQQGTVWEPVMSLVYVNDITEGIDSYYISLFADDTKL